MESPNGMIRTPPFDSAAALPAGRAMPAAATTALSAVATSHRLLLRTVMSPFASPLRQSGEAGTERVSDNNAMRIRLRAVRRWWDGDASVNNLVRKIARMFPYLQEVFIDEPSIPEA